MPDYKANTVDGGAWNRFYRVEIDNTHNRVPSVTVCEEKRVLLTDGTTIGTPVRTLREEFTNPEAELPLYNPETGELLGQSVNDQFVYVVLYAVAMRAALRQDALDAAEQVAE